LIRPPESLIGPMTKKMRKQLILMSDLAGKYTETIDRESAYEILKTKAQQKAVEDKEAEEQKESSRPTRRSGSRRQSASEAFFKSTLRSIGSSFGRRLVRGILGSLLGK